MSFENSFEEVVMIEGGYSNNPSDSGGKTRYGITESVARSYGYKGDMRELPLQIAKDIYKKEYWDYLKLDQVDEISTLIAREMFEVGVNAGTRIAARILQQCLNVFNRGESDYMDIAADGRMGRATLIALTAFKRWRGEEGIKVLWKAMNCMQGAHYVTLAEAREKDEAFVYGWVKNRVGI